MTGLRRGPEQGDGQIAVRETVDFLAAQKMVPLSRDEAYSLTSMVGDCRVTQVVDVRKGVHCMVPRVDLRQEVVVRGALAALALALVLAAARPRGAAALCRRDHHHRSQGPRRGGGRRSRSPSRASPRRFIDPHARRGQARPARRLRAAALLVRIGLDHEPWLRAPAARGRRRAAPARAAPRDLDVSRGIELLQTPRRRACAPSATCTCTASAIRTTGSIPRTRVRSPRRIQAALTRLSPADRERCSRPTAPGSSSGSTRAWRAGSAALAPYAGRASWSSMHDSWPYFARALRSRRWSPRSSRRRACRPPPAALGALVEPHEGGGRAPDDRRAVRRAPRWWRQVAARAAARAVTLVPSVGGDAGGRRLPGALRLNVRRWPTPWPRRAERGDARLPLACRSWPA